MIRLLNLLRMLFIFPGTIFHVISRKFFCDITNVPVYDVVYFNIWSKQDRYVIHEKVSSLRAGLLIGLGPFLVNSIVCMLVTIPYGYFYLFRDC